MKQNFCQPLLSAFILSISVSVVTIGCGSTGDDALQPSAAAVTQESSPPTISEWSKMLHSSAYSGKIAIMFEEGTGVRLVDGRLTSKTGINLSAVEKILGALPRGSLQRGVPGYSDDQIEEMRIEPAARGVKLTDWSLYYEVAVPDPSIAEGVLGGLSKLPVVKRAYPIAKIVPIATPDLVPQQTYLQPVSNGGLNITAAWNEGLSGSGISVIDTETWWNFDHEDLPIDESDLLEVFTGTPPVVSDPITQHGTSMAGIVSGLANNIGVKGIAYGGKYVPTPVDKSNGFIGAIYDSIGEFSNYTGGTKVGAKVRPGSILFTPIGLSCDVGGKIIGCLPIEGDFGAHFDAIKDAANNGLVVIEGAGNAANNIDATIGWKGGTGAIIVGASAGADLNKLPTSNCGNLVNVYAWGKNVVTTGVGDLGYGSDPNQWYTNSTNLVGTSLATAQIAGLAALLQELVQKKYAPTLKPWEYAYLNSAQMKEVLVKSGAGQEAKNTNGCGVGVQPDAGKAIQMIKDGTVKPTTYSKPPQYCQAEGWCQAWCQEKGVPEQNPKWCEGYMASQGKLAKPMDLDGDGRGDLIAFSRDHKWYVDLSSVGTGGDNYGSYDLVFDPCSVTPAPCPLTLGMFFPVVGDYNTDGKADLALYDSASGKWYIRFTDANILANKWGNGWDRIIDYSKAPGWKAYSRPVPGDYNGADDNMFTFDRWLDPAIATPDGHWLIDHTTKDEALTTGTVTGTFDKDVKFLTDQQLQWAPGWAYLPNGSSEVTNNGTVDISYAVPPGVQDPDWFASGVIIGLGSSEWPEPNAVVADGPKGISMKQVAGIWNPDLIAEGGQLTWVVDTKDFGGQDCHPVRADYDGDGKIDRSTVCSTEWRLEYSGNKFTVGADGLRHVTFSNGQPVDPLPGCIFPGGVAYQDIVAIYGANKFGCTGQSASQCTIFNLTNNYPPPVGPYFPICLNYWGKMPLECLKY